MDQFLIVFQALFFLASTVAIIMGGIWALYVFKQSKEEAKQTREDHEKKMLFWDKKIDEIAQRIDPLKTKKIK